VKPYPILLARRWWRSLQFRVFAALAVIILLFIPTLGLISYLQGKRAIEDQIELYAVSTANQMAERVRSYLSHHTSNVRLIKMFLENQLINATDEQNLIQYLHILKRDHPEFVNINFGDESGRFIMVPPQSPEIHKLFDPRIRPWYVGAKKKDDVYWTPVYLFASTQKPGLTVSIPVLGDKGEVHGVCGIDLDISTFSEFLESIRIGERGYAYIIENASDRIIAHPGLVNHRIDPQQIMVISTGLKSLRDEGKRFGTTSYAGETYFTAYTNYPENDWTVGITLPVADYLTNINKVRHTTATLVLVAVLLASALSFLLGRMIISPLENLQKGIETISKGQLDHKVDIKSPDVASSLATAFNQMATSLKKSREELETTFQELAEKEKLAALGQLTAGIAHEIKNPLGIMLGSAEVVADPSRPIEMREKAAQFIIDEVIRLNTTLKEFLAFAKPSPPKTEPSNLDQILDDALQPYRESMEKKGIEIERVYSSPLPACRLDPNQIRQVLINLFNNAVEAMPDGGRITVATEIIPADDDGQPERVAVSISDNGGGIADEHIKKIFEPFASFKDGGTGLGLAIVTQIIKLHQAAIHVESAESRGTTFKLIFPGISKEI
jgi:signal transduction histidine kinase